MKWNLICDSSCDLTTAQLIPGLLDLQVIPLTLLVGGREYRDDADLDVAAMLAHMKSEKGPSSTACPSPEAFAAAFRQADCSLCFTISGSLSGTYHAACLGRDLVLEEDPGKKIFVLDTKSTAGALVLLTRHARALLEAGERSFEAVCQQLQSYQAGLRTVFTLECFDNLVKNGRMRPLLGSLLHTLGVHVIAEGTREGTINVVGKARGENKTFQSILHYMKQSKDCQDAEVVITHCENLDGAQKLKEKIQSLLPVKSVTTLACRGLTSFYAMEKGLIVVF
jgi:DegV family protein with EDD domain